MQKKGDIIKNLHQACGSPVQSIWLKAIDAGCYSTTPLGPASQPT
jgi:hypothetical protein